MENLKIILFSSLLVLLASLNFTVLRCESDTDPLKLNKLTKNYNHIHDSVNYKIRIYLTDYRLIDGRLLKTDSTGYLIEFLQNKSEQIIHYNYSEIKKVDILSKTPAKNNLKYSDSKSLDNVKQIIKKEIRISLLNGNNYIGVINEETKDSLSLKLESGEIKKFAKSELKSQQIVIPNSLISKLTLNSNNIWLNLQLLTGINMYSPTFGISINLGVNCIGLGLNYTLIPSDFSDLKSGSRLGIENIINYFIGYTFESNNLITSFNLGLSKIAGTKEITEYVHSTRHVYTERDETGWAPFFDRDPKHWKTVSYTYTRYVSKDIKAYGFPIEIKLLYHPKKFFGIGVAADMNFNSIKNLYGFNFIISLGKN